MIALILKQTLLNQKEVMVKFMKCEQICSNGQLKSSLCRISNGIVLLNLGNGIAILILQS